MRLLLFLFFCLATSNAVCQSRVISAQCGKCKRPVSTASRTGQKCPHCGVTWGREDNSYSYRNVSPPRPQPPPPAPRPQPPVHADVPPSKPAKPVVNVADYGSKVSYGFSLLGGGSLFGFPVRYHPAADLAIEAGLHYSPSAGTSPYASKFRLEPGVMLSGGATFFGQKFHKERKDKINRNGFTVRTGHSFGEFSQTILMGGWASESFRRGSTRKSFILELGGGLVRQSIYYSFLNKTIHHNEFRLFVKLHWNRYVNL